MSGWRTRRTMKKLTRSQLIKRIDRCCQQTCKWREAFKKHGEWCATCVTCGKTLPMKKIQAGHCFGRSCYPLRWDEKNIHAQCVTGDTEILMYDYTTKQQKDVKVGDTIMGFDENTLAPVLSTVTECRPIESDTITITTDDGRGITGSLDHRVMTSEGWKTLEEVEVALCGKRDIIIL